MDRLLTLYPTLTDLLGAFFPAAREEGHSDAAAVRHFLAVADPQRKRQAAQEARALLAEIPLPVRELSALTLRHFADETAARAWLSTLVEALDG